MTSRCLLQVSFPSSSRLVRHALANPLFSVIGPSHALPVHRPLPPTIRPPPSCFGCQAHLVQVVPEAGKALGACDRRSSREQQDGKLAAVKFTA